MSTRLFRSRLESMDRTKREHALRMGHRQANELTDLVSLSIECLDCGHTKRWTRSQIALVQRLGAKSIPHLGERLACKLCKGRGGDGKNVNVVGYNRGERPAHA